MTSVVLVLDRVLGADGHETAPLQSWGPICGAAVAEVAEQGSECRKVQIANDFYAPEHEGDVTAVDEDSVWLLERTSGRARPAGGEVGPTAVNAHGRRTTTATQTPTAAGATPSVSPALTATPRPERAFVEAAAWLHTGQESPI
jgi:hypothetical protein